MFRFVRFLTVGVLSPGLFGCESGEFGRGCVVPGKSVVDQILDARRPRVSLDGFQATELIEQWGDDIQWMVAARPQSPSFDAWNEFNATNVATWVMPNIDSPTVIFSADANAALATELAMLPTQLAIDLGGAGSFQHLYRCVRDLLET